MLCLFLCSFFAFFVSSPFNQVLLVHRNCCTCFVKLFQKSGFWSLLCGCPSKKEECSDFNHSSGSYPILYITFTFPGKGFHFKLLVCYSYSVLMMLIIIFMKMILTVLFMSDLFWCNKFEKCKALKKDRWKIDICSMACNKILRLMLARGWEKKWANFNW